MIILNFAKFGLKCNYIWYYTLSLREARRLPSLPPLGGMRGAISGGMRGASIANRRERTTSFF